MQITATGLSQCISLPFNTGVTRPYALCIKYNQYAQPQKCVTKVATNYMAIYLFQELQISIQQKSKGHYEAGELMHIQSSGGIYTKQLIVCLYLTYLYKSMYKMAHLEHSLPLPVRLPCTEGADRGKLGPLSNKLGVENS